MQEPLDNDQIQLCCENSHARTEIYLIHADMLESIKTISLLRTDVNAILSVMKSAKKQIDEILNTTGHN